MAYKPLIPLATDSTDQSAADIKENFTQINTVFGENHETFGSAYEGKHKQVVFPDLSGNPTTLADEIAQFSKTEPLTGQVEWFIRHPNNGNVTPYSASKAAEEGWTYLANGLLLKWGKKTVTLNQTAQEYVWPTAIVGPATEAPPVFATQVWASAQVGIRSGSSNTDVNAVAVVRDLSDQTKVQFNVWVRDTATIVIASQPFDVWIMALGTTPTRA